MDRAPTSTIRAPSILRQVAFVATSLFGASVFWIAPRPPMGDLPQHAAQVAMLHDLLAGTSRWSELVQIHWLTPYLIGYAIATALSYGMPVLVAMKLTLTAGYLGFVAAGVALRKELGGDERLDWLLLPGYFGFSFQYGFYTFLVAAPVGLIFLWLAHRFARGPTRAATARLVVAGVLLFFSHGLLFVFCVAIGFGMTAVTMNRATALRRFIPFVVLGCGAVATFVYARLTEPLLAEGQAPIDWEWNKPGGWHRLIAFMDYVVASTLHDYVCLPLVLAMLAAPWLLGARLTRDRAAWIPLAVVIVLWVLVPGEIARTTYLYHRFALFLLPAYLLIFRAPLATSTAHTARAVAVEVGLALVCCIFFATVAIRERRFAVEAAPFETVMSAAEPGQRALNVSFDPSSSASRHPWAYHTYPLWYQVDRDGFVDLNFARLLPEVVRFRPGRAPPLAANVGDSFDWHATQASMYRYFFVRHTSPLPPGLFDNDECRVVLVREAGPWALFERRECIAERAPSTATSAP
jgi:hypothetical protein